MAQSGIDRIVMLLADTPNIREVVACQQNSGGSGTRQLYVARDILVGINLLGLVVEISAVFILGKPPVDAGLTVGANILIFVGILLEIRFENPARNVGDRVIEEAKAQAADANNKTKQAELEIARLFTLSEERTFRPG